MLLGNLDRKAARDRLRGHHPLRPGIQSRSPSTPLYDFRRTLQHPGTRPHNTRRATPGGYHTRPVWPDPLSLATTHGISFPAGTEMFHFPAYPPHKAVPAHTAGGSPHSEILGSKPCRRLPEAYRGPTRPSSVLSAKASTIRPCQQHTPIQECMPQGPSAKNSGQHIITLK